MNNPRFLLDEDNICYGCQNYKHWAGTDFSKEDEEANIDENGGICDATEPCFAGSLNEWRNKDE